MAVLTHSLYARDTSGSLSEDALQEILARPIDLQLPARVGVVPLTEPFSPEHPVRIRTRSVAARHLAKNLLGHEHYSHVSDITTELPRPGGIEGLRVLAARYRVRYLLLYSERFEDDSHFNGWAAFYPTLIGLLVAPGYTVESHGLAQVDMLDVRTGTLLFTVVEPMHVSEKEWLAGSERAHKNAQVDAAVVAAEQLARRVASATDDLVLFADRHASGERVVRTRLLPAPVTKDAPKAAPVLLSLASP
ncbi:MAG: hypothetical protein EXR75_12670 [Myxococcales bacterium]|nr:hypothetical protein [Myxococcales bacterium]